MRGNRRFRWIMGFIGLLVMCTLQIPVNAAEDSMVKRYNVVFVMDASGSMDESDESMLRYDAMELFLGLAADSGNYAGGIAFNEETVGITDLKEVYGMHEKQKLADSMRHVEVGGYTNIGKAILEAVHMLERSACTDLPSVIVLLTDGNTKLVNEGALRQSQKDRENAVRIACEKGYPIYSICLNADGTADKKELQAISDETGGVCVEVAEPEDIKNVFSKFYEMIYDAETVILADEKIPANGTLEKEFRIPMFGVEELNIIISTLSYDTTFEIWKPSGDASPKYERLGEADEMSVIQAKSFSVAKVIDPDSGWWKLVVKGVPNDDIKITMVYNSEYQVVLEEEGEKKSGKLNDVIALNAHLLEDGKIITDENAYRDQEENAVLFVMHDDGISEFVMNVQESSYVLEYQLQDYGNYIFWVEMQIDGMRKQSQSMEVLVENQPPVAKQDGSVWKINVWSAEEKTYFYDLDGMIEDAEDDRISFTVADSEGYDADISQDGYLSLSYAEEKDLRSMLTNKFRRTFSIRLRGSDSVGAFCEVPVEVKLLEANRAIRGVVTILLVVFLLIWGIALWKAKNRTFSGSVEVTGFNYEKGNYGTLKPMILGRGRQRLSDGISNGYGVDVSRVWIIPTKGDYIYLKASKSYYFSTYSGKSRKVRVNDGEQIVISNQEDLRAGVELIWKYDGNQYNY